MMLILTSQEVAVAAPHMMAAAQAHQRASGVCMDSPSAKPPNIESFFLPIVSFELILLSVEQSLRLLLLLHYSIVRDDTNHNPYVLYKAMQNKSGGKGGLRNDIITKMNALSQPNGIDPTAEKELVTCLKKHDSSYSNFRYFHLDRQGRMTDQWELVPRDVQVLHRLALALIHLNMDEMGRRGIGVFSSLSAVPQSQLTPDLKSLKDRLTLS